MNFLDLIPIYDFGKIERAIQNFFVAVPGGNFVAPPEDNDPNREAWTPAAGNVGFYLAYQALTFQQCRPRVFIMDFQATEYPGLLRRDANDVLRAQAWSATLRFGIITEPNYTTHTQLRAAVLAIIPQMQPVTYPVDGSALSSTGLNAYLTYHEVARIEAATVSTHVTPAEGNYQSEIPCTMTFGVRANQWPS